MDGYHTTSVEKELGRLHTTAAQYKHPPAKVVDNNTNQPYVFCHDPAERAARGRPVPQTRWNRSCQPRTCVAFGRIACTRIDFMV